MLDFTMDKIEEWIAEAKAKASDPDFWTRMGVNLTVALICAGVNVILDHADLMPYSLNFLATTILAVEVAIYLSSDENARREMVLSVLNPVLVALEAQVGLPAFLDPAQSQGSPQQQQEDVTQGDGSADSGVN